MAYASPSELIAAEQVRWWRANGVSIKDALRLLGLRESAAGSWRVLEFRTACAHADLPAKIRNGVDEDEDDL